MKFKAILNFKEFQAESIFKAYCNTFPENERRSEMQFRNLFEEEKVSVFSILNYSNFIGYFIIWELKDCVFLEHFEIFKEFRSQNLGSKVLRKLSENYTKIVLETEPENFSEIAAKRIQFYIRNGFQEISNSYIQPSYGDGKTSLELLLFANFQPESLEKIIGNIYKVVYGKY